MANTSATGGYLDPTSDIAEDDALVDLLQLVVRNMTGLPGASVRPLWQEDPPNLPAVGANWAAIGVTVTRADVFAAVKHDATGDGADQLQRQEELTLACRFYGPNAGALAARLRDGLQVEQNRAALGAVDMTLVEVGDVVAAPVLIKDKWRNRRDVDVMFRRMVYRTYPVLNLLPEDVELTLAVELQIDT